MKFKDFLAIFLGLVTGIAVATASLLLIVPKLDLPREHQIFQVLGIKKPLVLGFLPYWFVNKTPNDYSKKLSMISYFGLVIGNDGHIQTRSSPKEIEIGYNTLQSDVLKNTLETAKKNNITLSLVVYDQGEGSIATLINNPVSNAKNLTADILPIMKQYGFSDLNIDIESFVNASDSARQNFTQFVQTIHDELKSTPNQTLSIDLAPKEIMSPYIYEPEKIGAIVDHVILMAYDYNHTSSTVTGPVAPIGGAPETRDFDVNVGVRESLKVIPAEKLVLGNPLYGYQWETLHPTPYQPVIPSSGATASQMRVASLITNCSLCQKFTDPISLEPYVIAPGTVSGIYQETFFEDSDSLARKVELAKQNNLGGVALWALGYEDSGTLNSLIPYKAEIKWVK